MGQFILYGKDHRFGQIAAFEDFDFRIDLFLAIDADHRAAPGGRRVNALTADFYQDLGFGLVDRTGQDGADGNGGEGDKEKKQN
jgi:hypothetical protein